MTQPVTHGFPDWARQTPAVDVIYERIDVPDIDALTSYGPYFVGATPHVGVLFGATTNNFDASFSFFADEALTLSLADVHLEIRQGQTAPQVIPAYGPWLRVNVVPSAANGSFFMRLWATPVPGRPMRDSARDNMLVSQTATNIGAGATSTFSPSRVWPGPAVWSVDTAAATWTAVLSTISPSGTVRLIDAMRNGASPTSRGVYLPNASLQLAVTNTTGAAATFNVGLSAVPGWILG